MNCNLFDRLDEPYRSLLYEKLNNGISDKPKGSELYRNGYIGIMAKGKATILRRNSDGKKTAVRTLSAGELFGSASLFSKTQITSSIIAEENCKLCYISEAEFKSLLNEIPPLALTYIEYLSDRIRFLNKQLDAFTAGSAENKLFEYLLQFSDRYGNVNLPFGMAELSRRLKIGRTSLYRGLAALESNGLIKRDKKIIKIIKGE